MVVFVGIGVVDVFVGVVEFDEDFGEIVGVLVFGWSFIDELGIGGEVGLVLDDFVVEMGCGCGVDGDFGVFVVFEFDDDWCVLCEYDVYVE